jgi:predicted chitinase
MTLKPEDVSAACSAPPADVALNWPLIVSALEQAGIDSPMVEVAAAATVAVETGCFRPIRERMANPAKQPGIAALQKAYIPWIGRGFIQLTHLENYRLYSSLVGVDLIADPEKACDPETAAKVLAQFFKRVGVDKAANAKDWRKVRRMVNGGYIGWDHFNRCVCNLLETLGE